MISTDPQKLIQYLKRAIHLPDKRYRSLSQITLADWLRYHNEKIAFNKVSWMGIKTIKNVLDAWICQEIIHEVRPEIIIEIGSLEGGFTLYLSHLLDILGQGKVISLDIDRTYWSVQHPRIIEITGDSASEEIISRVYDLCENKKTMLIHDGNHEEEHVFKDLQSYADLISIGSYIVVEDGLVDVFPPGDGIGQFTPGPLKAIERFLDLDKRFAVDSERERYLLTCNPQGYIKRIA